MTSTDFEFPCVYNDGELLGVESCETCTKSSNCDVYAVILDEDSMVN